MSCALRNYNRSLDFLLGAVLYLRIRFTFLVSCGMDLELVHLIPELRCHRHIEIALYYVREYTDVLKRLVLFSCEVFLTPYFSLNVLVVGFVRL